MSPSIDSDAFDTTDARAVINAYADGVQYDDNRIQALIDSGNPRVGVGIPPIFGAVFRANADVRGFSTKYRGGVGEVASSDSSASVSDSGEVHDDEAEQTRELVYDAIARLERAHLEAWVARIYCRQAGDDCVPMEKFDRGENKNFDLWAVNSGVIAARSVFGQSIEDFNYNAVFVPNHVAVADLGGEPFVTHFFPVVLNCKLRDRENPAEPAVTADMFPTLPSGECSVAEEAREQLTAIGKTIRVDYTGLVATFDGINSLYKPDFPGSKTKAPHIIKYRFPDGLAVKGPTLEHAVKVGDLVVTNHEANAVIIRAGLVRMGVCTDGEATVFVRSVHSMLEKAQNSNTYTAGPPNNVKVVHVDDWYNIDSASVYALFGLIKPREVFLHGTSRTVLAVRDGMKEGSTRHPHVDGNVHE